MSQGVVEGPARVILDFLSEAHLIQKGEILITRATDTGTLIWDPNFFREALGGQVGGLTKNVVSGWTPYFPLLGGVVTELGGLASHGAVVAREYGLPAIVGLVGVTDFVKSGDIVRLDGNKGILQKTQVTQLEHTEDSALPTDGQPGEIPATTEPESTRNVYADEESVIPEEEQNHSERNDGIDGQRQESGIEETAAFEVKQTESDLKVPESSVKLKESNDNGSSASDTTPLIECEA